MRDVNVEERPPNQEFTVPEMPDFNAQLTPDLPPCRGKHGAAELLGGRIRVLKPRDEAAL